MYKTKYEIFCEKIYNEEIGEYQSYGIRDKDKTVSVSDVSVNLTEALKILNILNENGVSTVHIKDIIIDCLE